MDLLKQTLQPVVPHRRVIVCVHNIRHSNTLNSVVLVFGLRVWVWLPFPLQGTTCPQQAPPQEASHPQPITPPSRTTQARCRGTVLALSVAAATLLQVRILPLFNIHSFIGLLLFIFVAFLDCILGKIHFCPCFLAAQACGICYGVLLSLSLSLSPFLSLSFSCVQPN